MDLSTHTLNQLLETWGYLAVFIFVAIESTGIPFPGETMLIAAGVFAGAGHLNIALVIAAAAAGAIVGDNLGYTVGRFGGRPVIARFGKYIRLDEAKLAPAENFFHRHGDKTVFLGRFVSILRTWVAFLAGLNRMPWPKFLFFNAAGGITWAILYGSLAYMLGKNLPLLHRVVNIIGFGGLALVVVVAIVVFVVHRRSPHLTRRLFHHVTRPPEPEGQAEAAEGADGRNKEPAAVREKGHPNPDMPVSGPAESEEVG